MLTKEDIKKMQEWGKEGREMLNKFCRENNADLYPVAIWGEYSYVLMEKIELKQGLQSLWVLDITGDDDIAMFGNKALVIAGDEGPYSLVFKNDGYYYQHRSSDLAIRIAPGTVADSKATQQAQLEQYGNQIDQEIAVSNFMAQIGSKTSPTKKKTSPENGLKGGKPNNLNGGRPPKNYVKTVKSKDSDLVLTLIEPENIEDFHARFVKETKKLKQIPIYNLRSGKIVGITRAKTLRAAIEELEFLANHTEKEYFDKYDAD